KFLPPTNKERPNAQNKEKPNHTHFYSGVGSQVTQPWNKGKLTGAKPTLRKHVWAVRTRIQLLKPFRDSRVVNLGKWLTMIGLDACFYGTHSLRRTKATLIYKKTGNLRAVQLLLGHTKVESTVRYLGIEVDDALAVAEQIDV